MTQEGRFECNFDSHLFIYHGMADFYGRLLHVNNSLLEPLYLPFNSVLLTHTFVYLGQGQGKVGKLLQLFVDKQTGEEM